MYSVFDILVRVAWSIPNESEFKNTVEAFPVIHSPSPNPSINWFPESLEA